MHIQFNGERVLTDRQDLTTFLKQNGIDLHTPNVAVAINGYIALRSNWSSIHIHDGDQIELVHAVSGG